MHEAPRTRVTDRPFLCMIFDLQESLEQVLSQLREYIAGEGYIAESDRVLVVGLIRSLAADGDVTALMKNHARLMTQLSWLNTKYVAIAGTYTRHARHLYNVAYLRCREKGWDEWTAKSKAEEDPDYVPYLVTRDKAKEFSSYLEYALRIGEQRLRSLENASHNMRFDGRVQ